MTILDKTIHTTNFITGNGKYRCITKCRAGFMTVVEARDFENERYNKYPEAILSDWKKGALQTVEFQPEGSNNWLTVFARKGNKIVLIDEVILSNLTVGTINQLYYNTNLYNQNQYRTVGAKTWADKAFVMSETSTLAGIEFPMPNF